MRLYFPFEVETDRGFMGIIIIIMLVFSRLYFITVKRNYCFQQKNTLVSTMTLCIKAVINMEDKCLLNFDKFHL